MEGLPARGDENVYRPGGEKARVLFQGLQINTGVGWRLEIVLKRKAKPAAQGLRGDAGDLRFILRVTGELSLLLLSTTALLWPFPFPAFLYKAPRCLG